MADAIEDLGGPYPQVAVGQQRQALAAARAPDQAVAVRLADFDPVDDAVVQALFPQRRLFHIRQAATETELLVVPNHVGQQAHRQALLGFRRVAGDGEAQGLVDAAIEVGQADIGFVGRGGQGHGHSWRFRKPASLTRKRPLR
ncbi:hypothetical protein D9M72_600830 [compost metagenome]